MSRFLSLRSFTTSSIISRWAFSKCSFNDTSGSSAHKYSVFIATLTSELVFLTVLAAISLITPLGRTFRPTFARSERISIISAVLFPLITGIYGLSVFFFCFFTVGQLMMMISTNTFIANETKRGSEGFGSTGVD